MATVLLLAFVLAACHVAERLTARFRLPVVTGYVIAGVLSGAFLFRFLDPTLPDQLWLSADLALGLIAFTVGSELSAAKLRHVARSALTIALFESLAAFVLVTAGVWLVSGDVILALLLGAVACATAPAATVMVIDQYRAAGPLTSTVLAVVGIDDAIALVVYGFAAAVARGVLGHAEHLNLLTAFGVPLLEIVGSLAVGAAIGYLGTLVIRRPRGPREVATAAGAMILLGVGVANALHFSALLTNMAMGVVFVNVAPQAKHRVARSLSGLSALLYGVFFVVAGSRLDVSLLPAIGLVGLIYLVARSVGKMSGGTLGAAVAKSPPVVRRFVGLSLIPQIGVAVALAVLVDREFGHGVYGDYGDRIAVAVLNILLVTTIVTEIIGPLLTRFSLTRAGEIGAAPEPEESYEPVAD